MNTFGRVLLAALLLAATVLCWNHWRRGNGVQKKVKMNQPSTHKFLRDRAILLGTVIDDDAAKNVEDALRVLNGQGTNPIILYVNSPGGTVKAGWLILEAMETSKSPIQTVCLRQTGGVATFIFASGCRRFGLAESVVSFDEFSPGNVGENPSIEEWRQRFIQRVAPKLMTTQDTLSGWIATNRTFSGDELHRAGLLELIRK